MSDFTPDPGLVAAIERALLARNGRVHGDEITFPCVYPDRHSHGDAKPAASYSRAKFVWHCYACGEGGGFLDLAARLGIEVPRRAGTGDGLTLAQLAAAKRLPVEFLESLGLADGSIGLPRRPCVDIPYADAAGEVQAIQKRVSLHGDVRFLWRRGDHPLPYGVNRLPPAGATVFLVEGASDAWTLWHHGIGALGIPGSGLWRDEHATLVAGRQTFVWQEHGAAGRSFADAVGRSLPDVRVIEAPPEAKDPSSLYLLDAAAFPARVHELMARARPARERLDAERQAEADEALAAARELLEAPDLLERVERVILAGGYAGDPTPALLGYVAVTSRCLQRPLDLAFVAAAASGKNRAIDSGLPLMPETAYVVVKAGSARALVYGDADYEHRTVIVSEADSIPEEGPAASAVRALAADNSMEYDVVERDEATGKFTVRHIRKPGPTGLITTSTKPLGEQMATRMLTVGISDTPAQTLGVLHAHADAVNGSQPLADVSAFVAAQRWLELAGERRVSIPFAHALAEAVPTELVRMRRDFRQLLTVIEAVAFLHQRQRDRDEQGRIVATFDDYAIARRLLLDTFTAAATGGISAAVRDTARAVRELCIDKPDGVTKAAVAARLSLHTSTTWYRLRQAIRVGLVVNRETRKGQPAQLVPGDVAPDDREVLPSAEDLRARVSHPEMARNVESIPETGPNDAASTDSMSDSNGLESPIESVPQAEDGHLDGRLQRFNADPRERARTRRADRADGQVADRLMDASDFLVELREAGVELASGDRLRFRLAAPTDPPLLAKLRRNGETVRLALLREMAETIDSWPLGYRRWWWQTVEYVERDGLTRDEAAWRAYRSVAAEYVAQRAHIAGLPVEDQMLAAALDTWPGAEVADDEAIEAAP